MSKIKLAGTDLEASRLGFGCSALLGEQSRAEGIALLEAAFDCGINYFDVARVYGYGEAERLVGEFARGRRTKLIIATKFGIEPMIRIANAGFVRATVRRLMRFSPRLRAMLGRRARAAVKHSRFGVEESRRSLETSLHTLATDYIDVLLLHECSVADLSDELLEFLEQSKRSGKIRYFGVGTGFAEVSTIVRDAPQFAALAQFQNCVLSQNLAKLPAPPGAVITHGALGESYAKLRSHLLNNREVASNWSSQLGADCTDPATLTSLMLGYATRANQRGPVLFRSRRVQTIADNVRAIGDDRFDADRIEQFARLVREARIAPS